MKKYKYITYALKHNLALVGRDFISLEEVLNRFGREGYRIISITDKLLIMELTYENDKDS